jgi:acyl carrier protein
VVSEAELKSALRDWLVQKNPTAAPGAIQDDTPLIEQRLLTSIQVMDLALFLEDLRGEPLDMTRLKKGAFSSINAIWGTFFAGASA